MAKSKNLKHHLNNLQKLSKGEHSVEEVIRLAKIRDKKELKAMKSKLELAINNFRAAHMNWLRRVLGAEFKVKEGKDV